jgi:hypothetical protein
MNRQAPVPSLRFRSVPHEADFAVVRQTGGHPRGLLIGLTKSQPSITGTAEHPYVKIISTVFTPGKQILIERNSDCAQQSACPDPRRKMFHANPFSLAPTRIHQENRHARAHTTQPQHGNLSRRFFI